MQTITISDTTPPTITCPPNFTVQEVGDVPPCDVISGAMAMDNCDTDVEITCVQGPLGGDECLGEVINTFTAMDDCGNTTNCEQIINIEDTVDPTIICPPSKSIECGAEVIWDSPMAMDNCCLFTTEVLKIEGTVDECDGGVLTQTWQTIDCVGNTATCTQMITVEADLVGPSFVNCQTEFIVECEEDIALRFPDLVDEGCIADFEYIGPYTSDPANCPGTEYIVQYSATDACGRTAICIQRFIIAEDTLSVSCPEDLYIECSDQKRDFIINEWLNAADGAASPTCGVELLGMTHNYDPQNFGGDNCSPLAGSQTVTFTYTDACGRMATCSADIHIVDNEPPIFTCEAKPKSKECTSAEEAFQAWVADYGHSVVHDVCGVITWTTIPENPTVDISCGDIEVTFIATDGCGNSSSTTGIFTVTDSQPPVITKPGEHISVSCMDEDPLQRFQDWLDNHAYAEAEDSCGEVTWSTEPADPQLNFRCGGDTYPLYVTFIAEDECGNQTTTVGSFRILDDKPPVFTFVPEDITIPCQDAPSYPSSLLGEAMAEDACGDVQISFEDESIEDCCGSTRIVRTFTAEDECGNITTATQTLNLIDNEAPELIFNHPDLIGVQHGDEVFLSCTNFSIYNLNDVTYIDNCCGDLTTSIEDYKLATGNCLTDGFIEKVVCTWKAVDGCGNEGVLSITMVVIDDEPPLIGTPQSLSVTCQSTPPEVPPMVTDNCTEVEDITFTFEDAPAEEDCINGYEMFRIWTAMDACGNTATATQSIRFAPFAGPTFTALQSNLSMQCGELSNMEEPLCEASCGNGDYSLTYEDEWLSTDCNEEQVLLRVWTATDECGLSSTASQSITFEADNTAPVFSAMLEYKTIRCGEKPEFSHAEAIDDCTEVGLSFVDEFLQDGCIEIYIRTWTAIDACGNVATFSQTVERVEDNTPPEFFNIPNNGVLSCGEEAELIMPEVTDDCPVVALTKNDEIVDGDCEDGYTLVRTWTAVDPCGNISTVQRTFEVEIDNTPPVFTFVPEDASFECRDTVQFGMPKVMDPCSDVELTMQDQAISGDCANGINHITRVWTATDACGNVSTASQTIEVEEDLIAPIIAEPEELIVDCEDLLEETIQPIVTDNCYVWSMTYVDEIIGEEDCLPGYLIIRTWTAMDACGNSTTVEQVINVLGKSGGSSRTLGKEEKETIEGTLLDFGNNDGITPLFDQEVRIFPNPVNELLHIQFDAVETGEGTVQIFDITGKLIQSTVLSAEKGIVEWKLDMTEFDTGFYMFRLNYGELYYQTKLIKSKF